MKIPGWQKWLRFSDDLVNRLEELPAPLAKPLLSYASQILDWSLLGTGLEIQELSDDRIGVRLPLNLRTCLPGGGGLSLGVTLSVAEFMVFTLLGRHFPRGALSVQFLAAEVKWHSTAQTEIQLRLELRAADREAWLGELLPDRPAERELTLRLLSGDDRLIGEVLLRVRVKMRPQLPGPSRAL